MDTIQPEENKPISPIVQEDRVREVELDVDDDDLTTHILQTFEDAKTARSTLEKKWRQMYNQKHGILPEKTRPWKNCSNTQVPLTQIVLDTYQANLMESLFASPQILDIKPVSDDDVLSAEKRKQFLNWSLEAETQIHTIADQIIDNGNTYGDVFPKIRYVLDKTITTIQKEIPVIDENGQVVPELTDEDVEQILFDSVKIDVPNIDDIFKAPNATFGVQKENCEYLIHRVRISKAEYQLKVDLGEYEPIDFDNYGKETELERPSLESVRKDHLGISNELVDNKHEITLLEWYGTYYNKKKKRWQEIVVIFHPTSRTIAKKFINDDGFRPFEQISPRSELNSSYGIGIGIAETLKYLQAELNTIHNQRIDAASKRIMQPGFYRPGSGFAPKQFFLEPNGMYPLDDPQRDVNFPGFQDAPMSQFQEEQAIWRYMEQLMGISENIQGAFSRGEKSATEVSSVDNRSSIRFNLVYSRYKQAFKRIFEMVALLHQKYMPKGKEYRIVGHDGKFRWITLKKSDMAGKLDLMLTCSSVINEQIKKQVAQMIYTAAMQNPQIAGNQRASYEVSKYYFSTLAGGQNVNIDLILPKPPQACTRTPIEEHELLYTGKFVAPDIREDAQYHLLMHDGELNQAEFSTVPPEIKMLFIQHVEMTKGLVQAQTVVKASGQFPQIGTSDIQSGTTQAAPAPGQGGMKNRQKK